MCPPQEPGSGVKPQEMQELLDYGREGPSKENQGLVLEAGRCRHGYLSKMGSPRDGWGDSVE